MALGSNEVRLLDLTNVYSSFRNQGKMREPVAILKITDSRGAVLDNGARKPGRQALGERGEQISYLITDMLSDNKAREYMFGPRNVMELPDGRPAAVKTGTSNDWRDAWAIGYTPDVTVGVWVGNSDATPMQEIAGVNGAGVIWRDLMDSYNQGRPIRQFEQPNGIIETLICTDTGSLASEACGNQMPEKFIAGTEPTVSDVQYQTVRVGGDGNCLAASYTPRDQVREVQFPLYPERFRDWARRAGVRTAPTEFCPPPAPTTPADAIAQITQPSASATITTTQLFVGGSARGAYTLDFGVGSAPESWTTLVDSPNAVSDGVLGVWPTDGLTPGDYTLRLRLKTPEGAPVESRVTVRVERP
jgi:membrane peptidoglycan carboxypeptidase